LNGAFGVPSPHFAFGMRWRLCDAERRFLVKKMRRGIFRFSIWRQAPKRFYLDGGT
jgi:hypothetical protein